jgi:hypothetical protein
MYILYHRTLHMLFEIWNASINKPQGKYDEVANTRVLLTIHACWGSINTHKENETKIGKGFN